MKILALEFSSPQRSVAALDSVSGRETLGEVIETGPKSMHPLGLAERALNSAGIEREEIECIAVGLGPGSYTGIRAAIALAQGWQLARDVKLVGLTSVECMAAQAAVEGVRGRLHIVVDAQRNELYLATYEIGGELCSRDKSASPEPIAELDRRSGVPAERRQFLAGMGERRRSAETPLRQPISSYREIAALRIVTLAQAQEATARDAVVAGPEVVRWFPGGRVIVPRAATLAQLAIGRTDFVAGEEMKPIYLRETAFVKAKVPTY